ncbi:exodeoxyribonuclease VII large subunit [Lactobacillus selangorensis]|uniref:Exodeoxyribonuclease 7 large subunit n=1 Tax=Lactobacillus selangorensis TaxID=81857 RepID=A0A0R2FXG8_9LACO|nr:exodeoxyribonuclease VII large subunit [Lactobacillus selangorensis]KRN29661.1 exodeoxyribonuclease VII large subunit [Lactobacillus selangorensis]KRN33810.1 exodeoxyribonuclease VII large subunit [Lactobacillus selangorensis]
MSEQEQYLTVSALTKYIKRKFDADPYLGKVYLVGEISNFRLRPRHQYFSLKDENAKVDVVMFERQFAKINFEPKTGDKVIVSGRISVYERTGNYQMVLDTMSLAGIGDLYQQYEALKKKLAAEGLFEKQRPIPKFPKQIAVITSPSGAVIHDIMTTVRKRYPIVQLVLFPAVVQGETAAPSLVKRLQEVNNRTDFDTIIIGRGGGSIEDLWPFNEESVARAIYASRIPVISSVGHETDTTIADYVADVRVATPTAAAEAATPVLTEEVAKIQSLQIRLLQAFSRTVGRARAQYKKLRESPVLMQPERLYDSYVQRVDTLDHQLNLAIQKQVQTKRQQFVFEQQKLSDNSPLQRVQQSQHELAQLQQRLQRAVVQTMNQKRQAATQQIQALQYLSPLKILGRGYTYTTNDQGEMLKTVAQYQPHEQITIHVADGQVRAQVIDAKKEQS